MNFSNWKIIILDFLLLEVNKCLLFIKLPFIVSKVQLMTVSQLEANAFKFFTVESYCVILDISQSDWTQFKVLQIVPTIFKHFTDGANLFKNLQMCKKSSFVNLQLEAINFDYFTDVTKKFWIFTVHNFWILYNFNSTCVRFITTI